MDDSQIPTQNLLAPEPMLFTHTAFDRAGRQEKLCSEVSWQKGLSFCHQDYIAELPCSFVKCWQEDPELQGRAKQQWEPLEIRWGLEKQWNKLGKDSENRKWSKGLGFK